MKKFIKNKKGFTLVELLVATAILGMVSLTVLGLMSTGTNMYTAIQKRTLTLFKSQSTSLQLKNYFQNCSGLIVVDNEDDNKPVIFTDNDNIYEIIYVPSEKQLEIIQLSADTLRREASGDLTEEDIESASGDYIAPLSYNVSDINYKLYTDEDTGYVTAIRFDLTIERLGKEYTRSQTIAIRSKVETCNAADDDAVNALLESWLLKALGITS